MGLISLLQSTIPILTWQCQHFYFINLFIVTFREVMESYQDDHLGAGGDEMMSTSALS